MEKNIKDIDLINAYLNNSLSKEEVKAFEKLLQTNKDFKDLFEEHVVLIKGIERKTLKTDIINAKKSYKINKFFKTILFSSIIIISIIFISYFIIKSNTTKPLKLNFESELTQTLVIKTKNEVKVKGEKGIIFSFKPEDLEFKEGKLFAEDSLQIELIELTNQQDLLLANAQTKSDDKWLVSGGAYSIKIKSLNGAELQLKTGKTYRVKFPKYTNETMELFYGNRNAKGNMNWTAINKPLKDKKYYTKIYHTYLTKVDKGGGISVIIENTDIIDSGFLSLDMILKKYEGLKIEDLTADTLHIKYTKKEKLDDLLGEYSSPEIYEVISSEVIDSLLLEQKGKQLFKKNINGFYDEVKLLKFGWINVDRYINNIDDIIKLNLKTNKKLSSERVYLIDKNNNTVINIFSNEVFDLPKDRFFNILIVGIIGDQFYGLKKPFHSTKDSELLLDLKPINKDEIEEFLKF